jgi:hypothetical protein
LCSVVSLYFSQFCNVVSRYIARPIL